AETAYSTIRRKGAVPASGGLFGRRARLIVLVELVARDLLVRHLGEFGEEVDDLLLVDRRAQARYRLRIVAVEIPHLLLLPWELPCANDDGALHLFVGHLDLVLVADLRNHQAETHAALGDLAVLRPRLLLGRPFVGESAALLLQVAFDGLPDVVKLLGHESRRQIELVALVERIEKLALQTIAARTGVLAR